jgi:hypothetical protein
MSILRVGLLCTVVRLRWHWLSNLVVSAFLRIEIPMDVFQSRQPLDRRRVPVQPEWTCAQLSLLGVRGKRMLNTASYAVGLLG